MGKQSMTSRGSALALFMCALLFLCLPAVVRADALWPERKMEVIYNDKDLVIDASSLSEGYFLAFTMNPTSHRLKLRVVKDGTTLDYNLNGNGDYEVFPLQLGSGNYDISLYENVTGKKYSSAGKITVSVNLVSESEPFLYPNQYVDYEQVTNAVIESGLLCTGQSPAQVYDSVCNYMANNFAYDYVRAKSVGAEVLPDIEDSFTRQMGICQDLSAITVCMLRVQGIPARLMIGYADKQYHAWTVATVNGEEKFFDPTVAVNALKVKTYTTERFY